MFDFNYILNGKKKKQAQLNISLPKQKPFIDISSILGKINTKNYGGREILRIKKDKSSNGVLSKLADKYTIQHDNEIKKSINMPPNTDNKVWGTKWYGNESFKGKNNPLIRPILNQHTYFRSLLKDKIRHDKPTEQDMYNITMDSHNYTEKPGKEPSNDNSSGNYKIMKADGKQVIYKRGRSPSIKLLNKIYRKLPDDKKVPVVIESKKDYLNEYIKNQEKKKRIKFDAWQKKQYLKENLKEMKPVVARFTTYHNPYMEPRVVVFTDRKLTPKQLEDTVIHEYGHELWEKNKRLRKDWQSVNKRSAPTYYGTTERQEDFADSYMLYKTNRLQDQKRLDIIKDRTSNDMKYLSHNGKSYKVSPSQAPDKKFKIHYGGKTINFGAKGYSIAPGTKKGNNYCARSSGIKGTNNPYSANFWSRKMWACSGKISEPKKDNSPMRKLMASDYAFNTKTEKMIDWGMKPYNHSIKLDPMGLINKYSTNVPHEHLLPKENLKQDLRNLPKSLNLYFKGEQPKHFWKFKKDITKG